MQPALSQGQRCSQAGARRRAESECCGDERYMGEVAVKLYDGQAPNPWRVRVFLAEKSAQVPMEAMQVSYPQILVMRDFRRRFGFHL